ncbi:Low-density lipoprotein receptor-related protein 2 [Mactra antiquata]
MCKFWNFNFCASFIILLSACSRILAVRHTRNLIWAQTPQESSPSGVSRIVGIEGNPSDWVPSGDVQVRHISAPHQGWRFRSLAFNFATQTLYWSESANKNIQGLTLNGTTNTQTIFSGTSSRAEGLAVDWVSNNIYWTDSLYNWIVMAPLSSEERVYRIVIRTGLYEPHGIAVHPKKGYIFWTDSGVRSKIECSDLLGENRITIIDTDILHPRGLTIDYTEDMLYWVDSKKDTIECTDFIGHNRRTVAYVSGTILTGISVFENYLFITEQMQGHLRVHDKNSQTNYVNYELGYIPDGIIMYDETVQPGNSSACDDKGCQQICINDPVIGPKCQCGEGFVLNETDLVSCAPVKKFIMPSHIYAIGDAICQYPANMADMSLAGVSLESQCFFQRGRGGHYGLTFDAREHMLYYSENGTKSIRRINLEVNGTGTSVVKGVGDVQGLALDWVAGNIFWTDRTYNTISMARKDGMYPTILIENLDQPLGIVVHPERGQMYWTEQGKTRMIFVASMDGSNKRPLVNTSVIGMPNHLFLDHKNDRLYWADSELYSVRVVDLKTNHVDILLDKFAEETTFFGLSIFQDYLLWTDMSDTKNGIHAARLDKLEKVRGILHPNAGIASDLITFDVNYQPELWSACGDYNGYCEHLCIPTSNETKLCACGVGYSLDETDLRSCYTRVKTNNYLVTVDSYQKQIYQLSLDTGEVNAVPLNNYYKGVAIDIDRYTNTLYWTDNQEHVIMSAQLDGLQETVFRALPNESISDGVAVDNINQLLFYTCTNENIIVVVSLKDPSLYKTIVDENLDEPRDIIVHPERGQIYWTDWGEEPKIETSAMDGSERSVILRLQNDSWPNGIALDVNTMNLFWLDARHEVIGRINVETGMKKIFYTEPKAHYFGITLIGDSLYVTDWFRKHVSKLSLNGGVFTQVGPSKFSRLNGIAGYKKSDIRIVFSKCLDNPCSHLCLPISETNFRCACADDSTSPCKESNENPTISHLKNERDKSPALTIGLSVLGIVAVLIVVVAAVYIYNKKFRQNITHDRLVEDTSKVDTFYRITFPDPGKDEPNFDSGIENPSFECSVEDVTMSGKIVKYSPM